MKNSEHMQPELNAIMVSVSSPFFQRLKYDVLHCVGDVAFSMVKMFFTET
jgi:hypothetical protein